MPLKKKIDKNGILEKNEHFCQFFFFKSGGSAIYHIVCQSLARSKQSKVDLDCSKTNKFQEVYPQTQISSDIHPTTNKLHFI